MFAWKGAVRAAVFLLAALAVCADASSSSSPRFTNQTLYSPGEPPARRALALKPSPRRFSSALKASPAAPTEMPLPLAARRKTLKPTPTRLVRLPLDAPKAPALPKRRGSAGAWALALSAAALAGLAAWRWRRRALGQSRAMQLVVHELKSPLSAIESYADLMLHEAASAQAGVSPAWLDDLRCVKTAAGGLRQTAADMLAASLIESGRWPLERKPVALGKLAEEAVALFSAQARAKEIELRGSWPKRLPLVDCDAARMRQVLHNLIANALRFAPAGSAVELILTAESGAVRCTVCDRGPGIDAAGQERLFRKFSRLASSSGQEGSGLGLYIAKTIVEAHGGQLWYEGAPGQGSRFHFTLPRSQDG